MPNFLRDLRHLPRPPTSLRQVQPYVINAQHELRAERSWATPAALLDHLNRLILAGRHPERRRHAPACVTTALTALPTATSGRGSRAAPPSSSSLTSAPPPRCRNNQPVLFQNPSRFRAPDEHENHHRPHPPRVCRLRLLRRRRRHRPPLHPRAASALMGAAASPDLQTPNPGPHRARARPAPSPRGLQGPRLPLPQRRQRRQQPHRADGLRLRRLPDRAAPT